MLAHNGRCGPLDGLLVLEVASVEFGIELKQRLLGLGQGLLAGLAVTLSFLTGIDPVDPVAALGGEMLTTEHREVLHFVLGLWPRSAPDLALGLLAGAQTPLKGRHLGPALGHDRNGPPVVFYDVVQLLVRA